MYYPYKLLSAVSLLALVACGSSGAGQKPAKQSLTAGSGGSGGDSGAPSEGGSGDTTGSESGGSGGDAKGGTGNGGSSGSGASGMSGSGGMTVVMEQPSLVCPDPPANACKHNTKLPSNAPALTVGRWVNISPKDVPFATGVQVNTQGLALDPCDASVLYLAVAGNEPAANAGLYKTTDAGATWRKVGLTPGNGGGSLDIPIRIRIDPKNPQHVYVVDGVRGSTQGFWGSCDGGESFALPDAFKTLREKDNLFPYDLYDIAVDPDDFSHALVTSHSIWGDPWNGASGILETHDNGQSWTIIPPGAWGTGHAIHILYNKELKIGSKDTWLLGTQGPGMFLTKDAGKTWTKVNDSGIQHGGGSAYYDKTGLLFASGNYQNYMSKDNGETWTTVGPGKGYNAIYGDGNLLYTAPCFGPAPFVVSPEGDGENWTDMNDQMFDSGPFEMTFDAANNILYSASWGAGMWALKTK